MQNEEWKPVRGYEGSYEVSNKGRVRSLSRLVEQRSKHDGSFKRMQSYKGKLVPFWITKKGYHRCTLNLNGKKSNHLVHQLVAKVFISNDECKIQVNHINCIKSDNRVENLEWCTNTENYAHAVENKLTWYQK